MHSRSLEALDLASEADTVLRAAEVTLLMRQARAASNRVDAPRPPADPEVRDSLRSAPRAGSLQVPLVVPQLAIPDPTLAGCDGCAAPRTLVEASAAWTPVGITGRPPQHTAFLPTERMACAGPPRARKPHR